MNNFSMDASSIPSLFDLCLKACTVTNQVFASLRIPEVLLNDIFKRAKQYGYLNSKNFLNFVSSFCKRLDLRGILGVSDNEVFVLAERCTQLESLKINSSITQDSLLYLAKNCTTLQKLDLRSSKISNVSLLQWYPLFQLTSLTLCGDLSPSSIEEIITNCTNLKVLKLHTPNELLVNNTSITLPHLEKLKLWHSQKVKSAPLSHRRNDTNLNRFSLILLRFALTKCPLLKSLELDDLPFDRKNAIEIDKNLLYSIKCTQLERLALHSNYSIPIDDVDLLFKICPNLKVVEGLHVFCERFGRKIIQTFPTIQNSNSLLYFADLNHYRNVLRLIQTNIERFNFSQDLDVLVNTRIHHQQLEQPQLLLDASNSVNNKEETDQILQYFKVTDLFHSHDLNNCLISFFHFGRHHRDPQNGNNLLTGCYGTSKLFLYSLSLSDLYLNPNLTVLHLVECVIPSYAAIAKMFPHLEFLHNQNVFLQEQTRAQDKVWRFRNLKTLIFSGLDFDSLSRICPEISDLVVDIHSVARHNRIVLSDLIRSFPYLKSLKLDKGSQFSAHDHSITFTIWDDQHSVNLNQKPPSFTTLEELYLNQCNIAPEVDFSELNQLKKVIMHNCTLTHVIHLGPSIEHFTFTVQSESERPVQIDIQTKQLISFECHRPLAPESLSAFQNQQRLASLILHSGSFSKEILEDLLKNICLSTFRCQITTELDISLIWKLVQRWPKLKFNQKTLDFASQFPNVTDEQFIKIFTVAHCAVHLDLSYCRNLTSDILPFLRLRPLQVVKLNFVEFPVKIELLPKTIQHFEAKSTKIDAALVCWHFYKWPSLKTFNIAGAKWIRLEQFFGFPNESHQLEALDVSGLDFSDEEVNGLFRLFPNLQYLNVTGCPLSENGLAKLRSVVKCVLYDTNACMKSRMNPSHKMNCPSQSHCQNEIPTLKAQIKTTHQGQTCCRRSHQDSFEYLNRRNSEFPIETSVTVRVRLFDHRTLLVGHFKSHQTLQDVYAFVQKARVLEDRTFDLYLPPNQLLSRTDQRTLAELNLDCELLQVIRPHTDEEKRMLEERKHKAFRKTVSNKRIEESEQSSDAFDNNDKN